MPLLLLLLLLALLALAFGPQLWVRHIMRRHGENQTDIPGTGAELARHLIRVLHLDGVQVEQTAPHQDHYDHQAKAVRLAPENFNGRSLTAVAVAAHEVGHAMQFHHQEPISRLRLRYLPAALLLRRLGAVLLVALPVLALVLRIPQLMLLTIVVMLATQLLAVLLHALVLPEEWDASFRKALPILVEGDYLRPHQIAPVRQVLTAAALTYVAAALADVLNLARWLLILRR